MFNRMEHGLKVDVEELLELAGSWSFRVRFANPGERRQPGFLGGRKRRTTLKVGVLALRALRPRQEEVGRDSVEPLQFGSAALRGATARSASRSTSLTAVSALAEGGVGTKIRGPRMRSSVLQHLQVPRHRKLFAYP